MGFFPKSFYPTSGKGFSSIVRVEIEGSEEMLSEIEQLGTVGLVAARDGMAEVAQRIKTRAIPLIPDDPESPGLLRETARVYAPRTASLKPGKKIYVGVVVGGSKLMKVKGKRDYVAWPLIQHEDLTLKHTSGQAKFLERPGNELAPTVPDAITAKLDAATGGMGAR